MFVVCVIKGVFLIGVGREMIFVELRCRDRIEMEYFDFTFNVLNILCVYPNYEDNDKCYILWKREKRGIFGCRIKIFEVDEAYSEVQKKLGIKK